MRDARSAGFEPWAYAAFALAALTVALFVFLGFKPGGAAPVLVYRWGLIVSGWASAVGMGIAMILCLRRRPVLQRGRAWPLFALGASLWFCSLPFAYPSSHEGTFSPNHFVLPFEGAARVRYGGEETAVNPLLFDPARRFGTGFEADSGALAVRAPWDGTVVTRSTGRWGMVLVLATGPDEYCVLDGLDAASCPVSAGDVVVRGQSLGSAPGLLGVHLQDRPVPGQGEGIPMRYFEFQLDGRAVDCGVPVPPQVLAPAATPGPGR